ncbi:hypothetical protein KR52_03595 [Synechococcus sp. KORDI-52]|uniref:hypothetical protein n=1 Tax=Synechococcus sp. KORDI-52 TaxID=585425 RepID=UPI0004E0543A|nr:hypothetical protein [Synechococcus sp. KORDI-52]AII48239.1 hypothetical protein KR52_03595 [Synechococcus sp. KORDI-52]
MLSSFPQWQSSRLAWDRLIHPRPVLVMISNGGLSICWRGARGWTFRCADLSAGSCRDGMPKAREAIGELIADLLFDVELPGAELVLSLPPAAASWRVLDGLSCDVEAMPDLRRELPGSLDLPFSLDQSYLMTSVIGDSVAVCGTSRALIQAWVDIVEIADLPLRRISWSLTDALNGLRQITQDWSGDLAWLLLHDGRARLILMRDRIPEIDRTFSSNDVDVCIAETRALIRSWQQKLNAPRPLGWWFTLEDPSRRDWLQLVDAEAGEQSLNRPLAWSPDPWTESAGAEVLSPLAHLVLGQLHEEECW